MKEDEKFSDTLTIDSLDIKFVKSSVTDQMRVCDELFDQLTNRFIERDMISDDMN